jgi:hypothetical protein
MFLSYLFQDPRPCSKDSVECWPVYCWDSRVSQKGATPLFGRPCLFRVTTCSRTKHVRQHLHKHENDAQNVTNIGEDHRLAMLTTHVSTLAFADLHLSACHCLDVATCSFIHLRTHCSAFLRIFKTARDVLDTLSQVREACGVQNKGCLLSSLHCAALRLNDCCF